MMNRFISTTICRDQTSVCSLLQEFYILILRTFCSIISRLLTRQSVESFLPFLQRRMLLRVAFAPLWIVFAFLDLFTAEAKGLYSLSCS
jgi:hypothetical protein